MAQSFWPAAHAALGHVVIHGSAILHGGWIIDPGTDAALKHLRIDGQSRLVGRPAFLVMMLGQQAGAEILFQ